MWCVQVQWDASASGQFTVWVLTANQNNCYCVITEHPLINNRMCVYVYISDLCVCVVWMKHKYLYIFIWILIFRIVLMLKLLFIDRKSNFNLISLLPCWWRTVKIFSKYLKQALWNESCCICNSFISLINNKYWFKESTLDLVSKRHLFFSPFWALRQTVFRMTDSIKTQLVSAIHLQEVELQEKPADKQQGGKNSNNGEFSTSL